MLDPVKISNRLIEYSFYLLFFLVPLALTPWNSELFEFNKMILVYLLTTIITASWLIKMVATKKFIFRRSFWDIPLVIFFAGQLISTLLSIDRHTSFWGYYSRFNGGLLSIICYLLLYWALVSNSTSSTPENNAATSGRLFRGVFFALLASATLIALYGIAEHFGIDAEYWVQDVRTRVFSTLGQPNWLATYLVGLIPLMWALAFLNYKLKFKIKNFIPYFLFSIFYLCLLYTKSRSGLLGFGAAYLVFWATSFYSVKNKKNLLKQFFIFNFLFLILTLTIGTPWTPNFKNLKFKIENLKSNQPIPAARPPETKKALPPTITLGGTESGEIRKIVWRGAIEIWRHHPVFGTGPETFAYSYYWYRPREHNNVSEWDFLYNKAHNEYLNFAATTGTIGLLSYLGLIGTFIVWGVKKLKIRGYNPQLIIHNSLLAGFAGLAASNFFGFSVVPVALFFFLFPALSVILQGGLPGPPLRWDNKKSCIILILLILLILLIAGYWLLAIGKYWYADTLFARGEKLNQADQYNLALEFLQKAIKLRGNEPLYHSQLSLAAANLAVSAQTQKKPILAAKLTQLAIAESNKALQISPYHLNFWKTQARMFYKLAEIDKKYYQSVLNSLLRAAELAPTDAKIHHNLALLYIVLDQEEAAIQTLKKTIELKPNYDHARYALALFYKKDGKIKEAREELEYILEKINPNYQPAIEQLKEL